MKRWIWLFPMLLTSAAHAQAVINMPNGVLGCDAHATYDGSDNGKKTVVTGVANKRIYVCSYLMATGVSATNLDLGSGAGTDCATTYTKITPTWQLAGNDKIGAGSVYWNSFVTTLSSVAINLCVQSNAANSHQVEIWYTVQ
jgi:hypothetical protein